MTRFNPFYVVLLSILFACQSDKKDIRVACVGDSITQGHGISPESEQAYPVQLGKALGEGYSVLNAGRSATTLQKEGDFPYWTAKEFSNVFAYQPDVIVIKLGTNDTKSRNWDDARYRSDYQALIDTFQTISTHPKIFLCLPAPAFEVRWSIRDSVIVNGVIPAIKDIAQNNNLPVIDLYEPLLDDATLFPDAIHPDAEGAGIMAKIIASRISE